jgi:hypothetical protein
MATLSFDVPDDQLVDLGPTPDAAGKAVRLAAAFHLCLQGRISIGRAARLAGLNYGSFLEEATRANVDLFDYATEEIQDEGNRPFQQGADLDAIKQDIVRAQSRHS